MRLITSLVAIVIAGLAVGCGDSSDSSTSSTTAEAEVGIGGEWKGVLLEGGGGDKTFNITVTIDSQLEEGKKGADVSYPGLGSTKGCSGYWDYEGRDGNKYKFHETINKGENDTCEGVGDVQLTSSGKADALGYHWQDKGDTASGTLHRES